eukprot:8236386-Pyramimonas_sp.AAC.1
MPCLVLLILWMLLAFVSGSSGATSTSWGSTDHASSKGMVRSWIPSAAVCGRAPSRKRPTPRAPGAPRAQAAPPRPLGP